LRSDHNRDALLQGGGDIAFGTNLPCELSKVPRCARGSLVDRLTAIDFEPEPSLGVRRDAWFIARYSLCDVGTIALLAALTAIVFFTFRDYAISNDEAVQHHYGELILAYYASGFADRAVFSFQNLYLYGGLFDIAAVTLSDQLAIDPYELRHLLCALIGICGISATAATARLVAGPRAGLFGAVALAVCGSWYGGMFNHTKDIPLAAAMTGATYFLIRASRDLPNPRRRDVLAFGLLTGAALGIKVLGLLLLVYICAAIVMRVPRPILRERARRLRFALRAATAFMPALLTAYTLMIAAWPWAWLAPLNPIRGLVSFADFHYHIHTVLAGTVYEMATVPRWYVPIYLCIKLPVPTLFGAALAIVLTAFPRLSADVMNETRRCETAFLAFTVGFPLACQVILHGPAFTGLRHFLFVVPPLSVLAGIAFHAALTILSRWRRNLATTAAALIAVSFIRVAIVLTRMHPYEYLFYNQFVGGLEGASRRYVTDYWVNIMPEAVNDLEAFLQHDGHPAGGRTPFYSVAVCGERLPFEDRPHPNLEWTPDWPKADFFIAPTHMNCDQALVGRVVATIERLGVPIGLVKDRRAITRPPLSQGESTAPGKAKL
jgi:Dolichyl-phosphate-mannose-protein mannosyltransferase